MKKTTGRAATDLELNYSHRVRKLTAENMAAGASADYAEAEARHQATWEVRQDLRARGLDPWTAGGGWDDADVWDLS